MVAKTLYDKLWDSHVVQDYGDGTALIYIDRHLIHEVTSPQAFEGLRIAHRKPWRIDANLAVSDHNVPTTDRTTIDDPVSRLQLETLDHNCASFGIRQFKMSDIRQGIVHVIGPEQGFSLPGMSIVCGDSHTSTHGALAALAFGIGTSEVEHVLATQCLILKKSRNMLVQINGALGRGVTAKDMILAVIGRIGMAGGTGHTIEFSGLAIQRAVDGSAHDGVQHEHRSRRASGAHRGGRDDDRPTSRTVRWRPRAGSGIRLSPPGAICVPIPAPRSTV